MPRPWWWRWSAASTCRRSRASCPARPPTPTRSPCSPSGTTWTRRCAGWARHWAGRRTPSAERPPTDRSALRPGVGRRVGLGVGDGDLQRDVLVVGGGAAARVGGPGLDLHVFLAGQVDRHALALLELLGHVPRGGLGGELGGAEQDRQQDGRGDDQDAEHDQADDQAGPGLLRRLAVGLARLAVLLPGLAVLLARLPVLLARLPVLLARLPVLLAGLPVLLPV